VHLWPFDGWNMPARRSIIVEVYRSAEIPEVLPVTSVR
jgi:hypothetical protein